MRLVFCGTGEIGLPSFRALCDSPHEILSVFTQPDRPSGRDLKPKPSAIKLEAIARRVPVFQPDRMREPHSVEVLQGLAPDLIVVIAYGQILPPSILQIPRLGCLNVHTSILPRHRGASPIQTAILSGDSETGVSIMFMDEGLDTGDVLLVERTPIQERESAGELHDRLAALAPAPLLHALSLVQAGNPPRLEQDPLSATHTRKLKKTDGQLNWSEPARQLDLRVRAMNPWPGASTTLLSSGATLKIHRAQVCEGGGDPGMVLSATSEGIRVGTGEGCLLLLELQAVGRKRMAASEFLRGHPIHAGERFA